MQQLSTYFLNYISSDVPGQNNLSGQRDKTVLDVACKQHNIAYSEINNQAERNKAALELAEKAEQTAKAKNSLSGERINKCIFGNKRYQIKSKIWDKT